MLKPLLDPEVADVAPSTSVLTGYDEERLLTYIRLLDAAAENADWREVARIVLHIDPAKEPERAFKAWETHLARARWMTTSGYKYLLAGGAPH
ncbi:DNA -binding domain-containing protein [Bradyrhizobium sp. Arg314]